MKKILYNILLLGLILISVPLSAKHIIGGEITYVCNGGGSYDFTMEIYRDCLGQGAPFDNPAIITVYRGNSAPFTEINTFEIGLDNEVTIPENIPECLETPPDVCVERGTYGFTINGLNPIAESYHISYQRCCRNNTINNLNNPGDQGATYTIEITPASQALCNNSPTFNDFPPIVICAGVPINFDHSASDIDGDQLVYEFCSPILGGGIFGTPENAGNANACNGVSPNPACAPPYNSVNYTLPTYSAQNPMGGDPQVSINANTGLITGVPQFQGQYVVGVCVSEYRNGQLLSIVRRDFQFNVAECNPLVLADIQEDEIINGQDFVINSCGTTIVPFINQSLDPDFIDTYSWEFEINGQIETFTEWSPTITFPGLGTYEGTLFLNPGTECGDTANIFVNVYPEINSDYSYTYDTCVAGPVSFVDNSFSGSGTITNWDWTFGDGNTSTDQNPTHQFDVPGLLPVTLAVTDINGCVDELTEFINWQPAPAIIVIEPSTFTGCEPLPIFFNNLSTPIDSTYDIVWDMGDGTFNYDISPTHIYDEEGVYSVSVEITSPIGCFISAEFPNWITVESSPIAGFSCDPENPSNFQPTVTFTDESVDAVSWFWDFNNMTDYSVLPSPVYMFPDTGLQEVKQIVTHISGCQDTLIKIIDVEPQIRYFLPNAFTPNFDDVNDFFRGQGYFEGIENFSMTIWNRWGELIFETNSPDEEWNGRKKNVGAMSPNGVYVVVVDFDAPRGKNVQIKGFATLIK